MRKDEEQRRKRLGAEISTEMGGLVRHFRRGFTSCADQLRLGPTEAQLLWLLNGDDGVSTTDLARALGVDPANASTLLTKLESRGLVRRRPAQRDRRRRLVSLTTEGRRTKQALSGCMERRQPGFEALTTSELATFRDLLRRVSGEG
jgi:DNA-binding MarR family transcriptional regulator